MNICLSLGYQIKNPRSPILHNAGYKKLGIDNQFIFVHAEVAPGSLKAAIEGVKVLGIRGVSVTMPYKEEVMKYLDEIDKKAQEIGAVNTIVNKNGKLIGYNTDGMGAVEALEKKTTLKNKRVAIIGAGGAAKAIIFELKKKGVFIKIFNRSVKKAEILAEKFGCSYEDLKSMTNLSQIDIIINTTPIGMEKSISPISKKLLNKNHIVFDIIYSPKDTQLIKDAKSVGTKVLYGYEMLLYQGIAQFKLYTGKEAPAQVMKLALEGSL